MCTLGLVFTFFRRHNAQDMNTFVVRMSSPTGTGVAEVHFSDFQTVSFQMGPGNDVITITQTPNNSTVTVNAGGGDDTVSVGAANGISNFFVPIAMFSGAS